MLFGFVAEFVWTVPVALLLAASLYLLKRHSTSSRPLLAWTVSILLTIIYAFALSYLGGTSVLNLPLPLLPFLLTIAAFLVWLLGSRQRWVLPLGIIVTVWMGTLTYNHLATSQDACRLVIIQQTALATSGRSAHDADLSLLTPEERRLAEQANINSGALEPIRTLEWGEHPQRTAIFIIHSNVIRPVDLPLPKRGIALYIQQTDGTWRTETTSAIMSSNSIQLSPSNGGTAFRATGVYGTNGTEVSLPIQ